MPIPPPSPSHPSPTSDFSPYLASNVPTFHLQRPRFPMSCRPNLHRPTSNVPPYTMPTHKKSHTDLQRPAGSPLHRLTARPPPSCQLTPPTSHRSTSTVSPPYLHRPAGSAPTFPPPTSRSYPTCIKASHQPRSDTQIFPLYRRTSK